MKHALKLAIFLASVELISGAVPHFALIVWTATCDATQCIWSASWTEPTLQANGTALTSLQRTNLNWSINGGANNTVQKTASAATGGGTQTHNVTVTTPVCENTVVVFTATATNLIGTSQASPQVQVNRDRTGDASCNVPTIGRGPATLTFTGVEGGANPASQTINLTNQGTGTLSSTISDDQTWITVSPGSHSTTTETDTITVSINISGLTPNIYTSTVTITAAGATNTPQTVGITLTVTAAAPPPPAPPAVTYTMNFAAMTWNYKQTTVAWTQTGTCQAPCVTEIEYLSNSVPYTKVGDAPFGQLTFLHSYTPSPSDTFLCYRVRASNTAGTSGYAEQQCNLMPTAPTISLNPTSVTFTATFGGANPANKTVTISNSGSGPLNWTRTKTGTWLTVTPASGTSPSTLTLSAALGSLAVGTYQGTVTITASGATNTPQTVPVTLTINAPPPTIALSPTTLNFSGTQGGANPATQTVNVTNSAAGGAAMGWSASDDATWLTMNSTGSTPGTITATASLSGLAAGTYNATITVSATGATNTPQTIAVTFTVTATAVPSTIGFSPASLSFSGIQGGANPVNQTINLTNPGGGTLTWTITDNQPWLTVSPTSGTTTTETDALTISLVTSGLLQGTHNGTVTITAAGATNTPQTVLVTLTITGPPPTISRSPATLTFTGVAGGANPTAQSVSITNSGGQTLGWQVTDDASWLSLSANTGTAPSTLTVSVTSSGLSAGTYTGTITITASGATNTPQTVGVTLTLSAPPPLTLSLSPASLSFSGVAGEASPASQSVTITSTDGQIFTWTGTDTATWLSLDATTGTAPSLLTVSVSTTGLSAGTYTGTISISASGATNSPQTVSVTVTVTAPQPPPPSPTIARSPTSFSFTAVQAGQNPATQPLGISNSGGGTMNWSVSDNASWLSLSPSSGSTTTETDAVTVTVSTTSLTAGTYTGTITVSASGATNTPQTIPVTLTVTAPVVPPSIGRSPSSFSFTGVQNGQNPGTQPLAISNAGGDTLPWSVSDNVSWLTLSPSSGTATTEIDIVTLTVSTASLAPNTYTGTITISASGATNSPLTVPVTLVVTAPPTPPTISFTPTEFSFITVGAANPSTQSLTISEGGGGAAFNWSVSDNASWLSLSPTSGSTSPATITLTVDATGLPVGLYSGIVTITVSGASNTPQAIPIVLTVQNPFITLNASGLTFTAVEGGANPSDFTLNLTNAGAGTLTWSITDDGAWLAVSPTSGTTTTETDILTVSVTTGALTTATYRASLTITATGADNTPQVVPVVFDITATAPPPPPLTDPPPPPPSVATPESVGSPSALPFLGIY